MVFFISEENKRRGISKQLFKVQRKFSSIDDLD